jgi:hypothetical protein
MKVYSTHRNGFQEVIYQRAMVLELGKQGLDFKRVYNKKIVIPISNPINPINPV